MGLVAIPRNDMGTVLDEVEVKRYLRQQNADILFDPGSNLNIWHPYQEDRQGVWYRGSHICSMDRGMLPEVPVWTVRERVVRVPIAHLTWGELTDPFTMREFTTDENGKEVSNGMAGVRRKEKHKIIRVGWRHTFAQILKKKIPGVTKIGLETRFGINLDAKLIDAPEVIEGAAGRTLNQGLIVAAG